MATIYTVGISDCVVSSNLDATLTTHALGSCIAVVIYDPVARVGGLLHYMLPDSSMDPAKAQQRPFMFADTGIPLLFHAAYQAGAVKERIKVTALGGAQAIQTGDAFNIGKRNHMVMRKILWKAGVMVHHEDVGGTAPRTARLEIGTGRVFVSFGREQREIQMIENERRIANNGL
jgi:chemotaxis protein CheD